MNTTNSSRQQWRCILTALVILFSICMLKPATASERSLAGIRIFSPVSVILHKFGDPSFITSGTVIAPIQYSYDRVGLTQPGDTGTTTQASDMQPSAMQPRMTGGSAIAVSADDMDVTYPDASRYYYQFPGKGIIYEFVVSSDGRIIGIKMAGYHSAIRTLRGIGLGSNYEEIVNAYGYPDSTFSDMTSEPSTVTLIYRQSDHVAFRLVRNKVAMISVTAPD